MKQRNQRSTSEEFSCQNAKQTIAAGAVMSTERGSGEAYNRIPHPH